MKKTVLTMLAVMLTVMVCNLRAQTIFFENFNYNPSSSDLPDGWTVYGDTLTNHPAYGEFNQSWQVWYPDGVVDDGEAMSVTLIADGTWDPCDRWLITPRIALPADSVMSLLFRHHCVVFSQFHVLLSTTGTNKEDFTDTIDFVTLQPQWQTQHISLESYAGDSVYIAFVNDVIHGNGHCSQYMVIDDVEVAHLPLNSIALADVILPGRAYVGQQFNAKLELFNKGRNFVRSINYSYRINGGEPVEGTLNIGGRCWRRSTLNLPITITEKGEFTIEFQISQPNGVEDYDSTDNVVVRTLKVDDEPPVGIATAQDVKVMVYPNPTHDKVTVKSPETLVSAAIADMTGRRMELRLNANDNGGYSFDLTAFPQAAYFLILKTATGQSHTVKLVKY